MSMRDDFGEAVEPGTANRSAGDPARPTPRGRGRRRRLGPVAAAVCLLMAGAGTATAAVPATGSATAGFPTADRTPAGLLQAGAQQGIADGYPGVIGMVQKGDTAQYVRAGLGDLTNRVPADPKATFRIGSNTKAFTAAVLLQLVGEKKLSLADSVAKWLPGAVAAHGYDGSAITIRQLLNHTSGLPEYIGKVYSIGSDPYKAWAPQTLVDIALAQRAPTAEPGESFGYSNANYVLAGMVIKAVTGEDAGTQIQRRIIEPLGLHHTGFPAADPALYGNYLRGYAVQALIFRRDVTVSNVQVGGAAGAMVSTLDDMATFFRALVSGSLLGPELTAELKTTVPAATDTDYGLGVEHMKLPCGQWVWGHNGAVLGYFSEWFTSDDGEKQVLLANNEYHLLGGTKGQLDTTKAATEAFCAL